MFLSVKSRTTLKNLLKTLMIFAGTLLFSFSNIAFAYVGPGAGITALGALWGVIVALLFIIGGFLVWPIRAFLKRKKLSGDEDTEEEENEPSQKDKV